MDTFERLWNDAREYQKENYNRLETVIKPVNEREQKFLLWLAGTEHASVNTMIQLFQRKAVVN
ncbi:MAG: hypothetical protein EOM42_06770 [Negativicutes bacterium]|nr:hypothetical protein [Negativicutes bacterium]